MKLTIPLTGTVAVEGSVWGKGELVGDPDDPILPIDINLGDNVGWKMVDVDLDKAEMLIEVTPRDLVQEPTGEISPEGDPIFTMRVATIQEKQAWLQQAKDAIEGHTKDELYALSNCPRLKRPFKVKG